MKLAGYIKPYKELIFTIPIYTDGIEFFTHDVDLNYKIKGFDKTNVFNLIEIGENTEFKKGVYGAIIFIGKKNDLIIKPFEESLKEISEYLLNETKTNEFIYVKEDLSYFKSLLK